MHSLIRYPGVALVLASAMALPVAVQARQFPPESAIRLQVEPPQTEVFVDGEFVGIVDDFDGNFQRLRLYSGQHDIELYLPGHRSVKQKVFLQPHETFRIRYTMVPLDPGEASPVRPMPPPRVQPPAQGPPPAERPVRSGPGMRRPRTAPVGQFGALAVRVQPGDAELLIDGERWEGAGQGDRLIVELPAGMHRVEIRKDGFEAYSRSVDIRAGETTPLNVSLIRD